MCYETNLTVLKWNKAIGYNIKTRLYFLSLCFENFYSYPDGSVYATQCYPLYNGNYEVSSGWHGESEDFLDFIQIGGCEPDADYCASYYTKWMLVSPSRSPILEEQSRGMDREGQACANHSSKCHSVGVWITGFGLIGVDIFLTACVLISSTHERTVRVIWRSIVITCRWVAAVLLCVGAGAVTKFTGSSPDGILLDEVSTTRFGAMVAVMWIAAIQMLFSAALSCETKEEW